MLILHFSCTVGFFIIFIVLATGLHIRFLKQRKHIATYNVDNLRTQNSNLPKELFKCFSLINTIGKFLHIKPNELNLECICGIKFISMGLIITGHCLIFIFGGPVENKNVALKVSLRSRIIRILYGYVYNSVLEKNNIFCFRNF